MERLPDGTTTWKRSPGGLVTALEPLLRRRAVRGSAGRACPTPTTNRSSRTDLSLCPVRLSADDVAATTRASPTPRCGRCTTMSSSSRSTTASGGTPTSTVNRRFAEATVEAAAEGATVWMQDYQLQLVPEDAADAAARSDHRLLPAHPVPAGRAVHADAVADRDHRGPARRRPGRLPSARRRAELPDPGPPAGGREHLRARSVCGRASARSRSVSAP